MRAVRVLLLVALGVAWGCGKADLGESCETSGAADECVESAICTKLGDDTKCLKVCEDQADCGASESCNGVSGSSTKSCQPD